MAEDLEAQLQEKVATLLDVDAKIAKVLGSRDDDRWACRVPLRLPYLTRVYSLRRKRPSARRDGFALSWGHVYWCISCVLKAVSRAVMERKTKIP